MRKRGHLAACFLNHTLAPARHQHETRLIPPVIRMVWALGLTNHAVGNLEKLREGWKKHTCLE